MGLFGDKLLLKLNASSTSSGKLELDIEKADNKTGHLLPFSCISLIAEQLTVLTFHHPLSLRASHPKVHLPYSKYIIIQFQRCNDSEKIESNTTTIKDAFFDKKVVSFLKIK